MTPSSVARFMAGMFQPGTLHPCTDLPLLLDAGAGALSCAFLDRWLAGGFGFQAVEARTYEVDERLRGHLRLHLAAYSKVKAEVISIFASGPSSTVKTTLDCLKKYSVRTPQARAMSRICDDEGICAPRSKSRSSRASSPVNSDKPTKPKPRIRRACRRRSEIKPWAPARCQWLGAARRCHPNGPAWRAASE